MNRRTPLALALSVLLAATTASAQQEVKLKVDVRCDLAAAPDEGFGTVKMVKGDASTVVALKTRGTVSALGGVQQKELGWTLSVYDLATMKQVKNDVIKILYGLDPVNLETIEHFGGRFRLIATQPDPETGNLRFIQQVLDPRSLTGKGAMEFHLMPFDRLNKGHDYYNKTTAVGFTSVVNQDSSMIMLHLTPDNTTRTAGCPVHAMVFSRDMKLKWENTLELPGNVQAMQIISTRVDKKGTAWYLVKNITDLAPRDPKVTGYQFVLYKLDSLGQHSAVIDIPGGDYANDARIELLPDGKVLCGGVYASEEHSKGSSLGLFITTLDPATANDPKGMRFGGFRQHEMNKVVDPKKGELPRSAVQMVRVFPRNDGGVDIVAEDNSLKTFTVSGLDGKPKEKTSWEHGPVHVMRFPPSGDPTFYTMVDRQLFYENNEPGRIIATEVADVLFLFMNDDESYVEKRKEKIPLERVAFGKDLVMFEFKSDGTFKNKSYLKDIYDQVLLYPKQYWYLTPTLIGAPGTKGWDKDKTLPVSIVFGAPTRR